MSMKLYYAPGTCAVAVWISLEWAGADYEVERVQLNSPEYKKINPLGAVPALDSGNGEIKTQANAILQYVAASHPEADLGADEGVEDEFLFNELGAFLTGDVHPAFWPLFMPQRFTSSSANEELAHVKEASYKQIDKVMTRLDQLLDGREHLYKDKKTVLDAYAYILTRWTVNTPKSWQEYPNVKKFMEHVAADPDVKRIVEESTK